MSSKIQIQIKLCTSYRQSISTPWGAFEPDAIIFTGATMAFASYRVPIDTPLTHTEKEKF